MENYFQFPGWRILYRDINVAVFSELVGGLIFSVLAGYLSIKSIELSLIFMGWLFASVIAFVPAIAGGIALSCMIYADVKDTRLSKTKSTLSGIVVGVLSALIPVTIFLKLAGTDYFMFIYALLAITISMCCGAWAGQKINRRYQETTK